MSDKKQLTTFNEIIEVVLKHEGGYVNDPTDLGGDHGHGHGQHGRNGRYVL